jgi:hypothetical protein
MTKVVNILVKYKINMKYILQIEAKERKGSQE